MASNEFWISLTSPYAYLAAMRIDAVTEPRGVTWRWQPVVLAPLFKKLGWQVNPYADFPIKQHYMWHDVARTAATMGLPFRKPAQFPQRPLAATKVALEAFDRGFGESYCKAVYHANFGLGRDIADPAVLQDLLCALGQDGLDAATIIADPGMDTRIEQIGATALARGLFGVPTFFVGDEMFWGNDRLEQAVEWAAGAN